MDRIQRSPSASTIYTSPSTIIPTCREYAYVEAISDEKGPTTAGFLVRALAFFRALGVCIKRILTDNGKNYTSRLFRTVALAHRITLKLTRPYRPQTNGKAEAFIKILPVQVERRPSAKTGLR